MPELILDDRDMAFVLFEQLKIHERLGRLARYKDYSREDYEQILREGGRFAREVLAPINEPSDREGCRYENGKVYTPTHFKETFHQFAEGGWIAISDDPEFGGMALPVSIAVAATEMFIAACPSFAMYTGLAHGVARVIVNFGTEEQRSLYVPRLFSGQWSGTMCLTEPQAGSYVGDTKTMAVREGDHYKIKGTKIFISCGEHDMTENIVHLVLARTPGAPPGTKGISLFLVPKYRVNPDGTLGEPNDVFCSGIEEKMGIHGSATCTLNFGDNDRCYGYLIGQEQHGIAYMFQLMNEARLSVGIQGLSIGGVAYRYALKYAKERIQGVSVEQWKNPEAPRVAIIEHPDVRRMLMMMKAYIDGMRALLFKVGYWADLAHYSEDDTERETCQDLVDLLTPVCKAYATDWGYEVTTLAVQVHGGYGYIREYGVEQCVRDLKIGSIYEGTNGIQALDLLGRKLSLKGGMLFMRYMQLLNTFVEENEQKVDTEIRPIMETFVQAKDALAGVTMFLGELGMKNEWKYPTLCATPYLHLFGDVTLGYLLLEQALIAKERLADSSLSKAERTFYDNKVKTAKFFTHQIMPRVHSWISAIQSKDQSALEVDFSD
ncbi:MAG: acyl-CoA dehydrogenase [Deltaproteobacteria bacterium]|nr:MAG: acyl-CoA dehydrogenase [Deltaproteobacteria bacterium]